MLFFIDKVHYLTHSVARYLQTALTIKYLHPLGEC
jgi:hypothetical protein